MKDEYLIVSKTVLPDYFEKVIEARELIRSGEVREVSEAVKRVGISRSTYYKYKDTVFVPNASDMSKKAIFSMILTHEKGVLGRVLSELSGYGANVLTINQNLPIGSRASVVISIDTAGLTIEVKELLKVLSEMNGVENPSLIDIS